MIFQWLGQLGQAIEGKEYQLQLLASMPCEQVSQTRVFGELTTVPFANGFAITGFATVPSDSQCLVYADFVPTPTQPGLEGPLPENVFISTASAIQIPGTRVVAIVEKGTGRFLYQAPSVNEFGFGPSNPCNFQVGPLVATIQGRLLAAGYFIAKAELDASKFGSTTCGAFEDYVQKNLSQFAELERYEQLAFGKTGVCGAHFVAVRPADCALFQPVAPSPAAAKPSNVPLYVGLGALALGVVYFIARGAA